MLSLTTIQIQEAITTSLDKRAKDMEAAIYEMLANPNLKAQFYDHPVIRGLTANKRNQPSKTPAWFYNHPLVRGFTQEKRRIPSYIPSQQFALSLFDIAMTAGTESSLIQQGIFKIRDDLNKKHRFSKDHAAIDALNILVDLARSAASTEAARAVTKKTLDSLKTAANEFSENYPAYKKDMDAALKQAKIFKEEIDEVLRNQPKEKDAALNQLKRGIAALSVISPEVNQTLNALLLSVEEHAAQGETKFAQARQNVEKWFDDSMDRVSGVFKRYSQTMALIIGFFIALLLNVDSISLTFYLWREPSVRAVLANRAEEFDLTFSEQGGNGQSNTYETVQNFREQFEGLKLPVGWSLKDKSDAIFIRPSEEVCNPFPQEKDNDYFGISFPGTDIDFLKNKCLTPSQPDRSTNIVIKFLGIVITAVAARQGAPFWFDILKRAVNLRGTGANPVEKEGK